MTIRPVAHCWLAVALLSAPALRAQPSAPPLTVAAKGADLFTVVIAVAPISDWRLCDTICTGRFMSTPPANPLGYQETAPQNFIAGIRTRCLLVHGTGNHNMHPRNSVQLIERMVNTNLPLQQLFCPNRTHSISGGNTTVHLHESVTRFIRENL